MYVKRRWRESILFSLCTLSQNRAHFFNWNFEYRGLNLVFFWLKQHILIGKLPIQSMLMQISTFNDWLRTMNENSRNEKKRFVLSFGRGFLCVFQNVLRKSNSCLGRKPNRKPNEMVKNRRSYQSHHDAFTWNAFIRNQCTVSIDRIVIGYSSNCE